jgi:hypothetical protein
MVECNKIIELYKGHFQLILDFPDKSVLNKIIDRRYKFVWLFEHIEDAIEWSEYSHSLYGIFDDTVRIRTRNIKMEVLINTEDFLKYVPSISQSLKIIQTNIEPPYYLNLENLYGKGRYDLLKSKIDYLFELEIPGATDYSPIISPNREYLESLLKLLV